MAKAKAKATSHIDEDRKAEGKRRQAEIDKKVHHESARKADEKKAERKKAHREE